MIKQSKKTMVRVFSRSGQPLAGSSPDALGCGLQARAKAIENKQIEDKRRAVLYKELEAKLMKEREEAAQWDFQGEEDDEQQGEQAEVAADARSPSLIDAIVQGQVGAAELSSLAEVPAEAAAPAAEERPASLEKPRRKGRVKTVRARKRKKRRYFWLVLKGTRTPGMRSKLFEGEWVEQMDKYDLEQAKTPEERAFMEQANEEFQKAWPRPGTGSRVFRGLTRTLLRRTRSSSGRCHRSCAASTTCLSCP